MCSRCDVTIRQVYPMRCTPIPIAHLTHRCVCVRSPSSSFFSCRSTSSFLSLLLFFVFPYALLPLHPSYSYSSHRHHLPSSLPYLPFTQTLLTALTPIIPFPCIHTLSHTSLCCHCTIVCPSLPSTFVPWLPTRSLQLAASPLLPYPCKAKVTEPSHHIKQTTAYTHTDLLSVCTFFLFFLSSPRSTSRSNVDHKVISSSDNPKNTKKYIGTSGK